MSKTKKPDGGDAFPQALVNGGYDGSKGMTLRDWFAGQFLTSLAPPPDVSARAVATKAYEVADAMIAERAK
jgi:hypothetical protein